MIGQPPRALPIASITEPGLQSPQPEKSHYTSPFEGTRLLPWCRFHSAPKTGHAPLQRNTAGTMRYFRNPETAVHPIADSLGGRTNCGFGCHVRIFDCTDPAGFIRSVNGRPRIDSGRPYFPSMRVCLLRE